MPLISVDPAKQILALDPARYTGFAHSSGRFGTWDLGTGDLRLKKLRELVLDSARRWGCRQIACEYASFGSHHVRGQALANELLGAIRVCAAELNVPVVTYGPSSIKKFICGNGRAEKAQIIRSVETWTGLQPANSDEADAIAVLVMCQQGYQANTLRKARKRRVKPLSPGARPRRKKGYLF